MDILTGKRFLALRCGLVIGVGLAAGLLVPVHWGIILAAAVVSIIPVVLIDQRFLFGTLLLLAAAYGNVSRPVPIPKQVYGTNIEIEAVAVGKTGDYSIFSIETPQELSGKKVLVYLNRSMEEGTRCKISGILLPTAFPRNPGVPDRNLRLEREGVIGRFSEYEMNIINPPKGLRKFLNTTRKNVIDRNRELFGENASIYTAILLGEKLQVPDQVYADMKRTGTLHLLAVSGLHIGVLVAFLFFFLRFFHIPRWLIPPLLAVLLCAYIALVGPRPSILRASIMSLIIASGFILERKVLPLNSLAVAALVILFIDPSQILDVGFQLSFAAASGIIIAAGLVNTYFVSGKKKAEKRKSVKLPKPVIRWVVLPIALSVAATLFTMPILAANFHQITFFTILANIPIIPLVSALLPVGLIALAVSFIWFPLGKLIGWIAYGLIWVIKALLSILPGHLTNCGPWPLGIVIALFLGFLILHSERKNRKSWKYALVILLVGANLSVWPWALKSTRPRLTLLDTYHGNVALLESDGCSVLLNPGSRAEPTVKDYLLSRNIHKLDWVLCLSDKEGDLSNLDSLKAGFKVEQVGSALKDQATTVIPYAGRMVLPSCTLEFDLASRSRPFYVIEGEDKKVVFVSRSDRFDTTADVNYLLNRYVQPVPYCGRTIAKEGSGEEWIEQTRQQGGMVFRL